MNIPDAREAIESFSGTVLIDNPAENQYPTPLQLTENESCAVGRLRVDQALNNGLSLWVVGDQLWKGAAQNAIQIAESMIAKNPSDSLSSKIGNKTVFFMNPIVATNCFSK